MVRTEAGPDTAGSFVSAFEEAVRGIGRFPRSGSTTFAHLTSIPGLGFVGVAGFAHLVFSVEASTEVRVLRVLHSRRDVGDTIALPGAT